MVFLLIQKVFVFVGISFYLIDTMTNDNDSFDSSDFSEEMVNDEFADEDIVHNKSVEKEESIDSFGWIHFF